jgi:hypothetical protein
MPARLSSSSWIRSGPLLGSRRGVDAIALTPGPGGFYNPSSEEELVALVRTA